MKKVLSLIVLLATLVLASGGLIVGNPGPLANGYYYRTTTQSSNGTSYTGYIGVTSEGHIFRCNNNGYSNSSQSVKITLESDNGRICTMTWMAQGTVWTEVQTMHIMRDDQSDRREINIWRSVTNINGDAWATYYTGTLSSMGRLPQ